MSDNIIIPDEWKDWKGNFHELVTVSAKIIRANYPDIEVPTASIVRYYQQVGLVGRGETVGRSSIFSVKEIREIISAKWLVKHGISLNTAKKYQDTAYSSPKENDSDQQSNSVMSLVSQMMTSAGISESTISGSITPASITRSSISGKGKSFTKTSPDNFPSMSVEPLTSSEGSLKNQVMGVCAGRVGPVPLRSFVPDVPTKKASGGNLSEYTSLPRGGTASYTLDHGVKIELSTNSSVEDQAKELMRFADLLLGKKS